MKSNLICLAVIVGNEAHNIERFLDSFWNVADTIVIVRSIGNQQPDETRDISFRFETSKADRPKIDWAVYSNSEAFPHVDSFGSARQMAWDMARRHGTKYVMWADADDLLAPGAAEALRAAAEKGEHDVYICPYHVRPNGEQIVHRERMVRNDGCSRWRYAIHEQLAFTRDVTYCVLNHAVFLHAPGERKTSSHERNVNILTREVESAGRNFFYLQQEFLGRDAAKHRQYALSALACPDLEDVERYEVYLNLAQTENGPKAKEWAALAHITQPDRREALALLTGYALVEGKWPEAHALGRQMSITPKPSRSYWNLNHAWYSWKGRHLYAQTLRRVKRVQEADELEANAFQQAGGMFSIVHATLGRPIQALAIRDIWLSRARNPDNVEYLFGLHHDDKQSERYLGGFKHSVTEKKGAGPNLEACAAIATGNVLIQAQDDIFPPQDWDVLIAERLAGKVDAPAFLAVSDGVRKDRLCVTSIMTRAYMKQKRANGCDGCGFGHPGYFSMYWDTENTYRAYKDGVVIEAKDLVFYHDHPAFNPGKPWDETYRVENAPEHYEAGARLFRERNPEAATDGILS